MVAALHRGANAASGTPLLGAAGPCSRHAWRCTTQRPVLQLEPRAVALAATQGSRYHVAASAVRSSDEGARGAQEQYRLAASDANGPAGEQVGRVTEAAATQASSGASGADAQQLAAAVRARRRQVAAQRAAAAPAAEQSGGLPLPALLGVAGMVGAGLMLLLHRPFFASKAQSVMAAAPGGVGAALKVCTCMFACGRLLL